MPCIPTLFDNQFCGSSAVPLGNLGIVAIETGDLEMADLLGRLTHSLILSMVANAAFARS